MRIGGADDLWGGGGGVLGARESEFTDGGDTCSGINKMCTCGYGVFTQAQGSLCA